MDGANRRLMWHGMLLFIFGLFTGFAEAHVTNVRMGLAAHLEGVMNGTFLIAVGAIWNHVVLAPLPRTMAYWLALYGTYMNWVMTSVAAILGTAALSPVTAAGHSGSPLQERLVTVGFLSVGITIILSCLVMLWGLRGKAATTGAEKQDGRAVAGS
jgi:hydroxylaminobenzene mutase